MGYVKVTPFHGPEFAACLWLLMSIAAKWRIHWPIFISGAPPFYMK